MKAKGLITAMAATAFAAAGALPGTASATLYTFGCITNNSATNCSAGQAQLSMDVTAFGSGVRFLFANSGPAASSVEQVFFDDGVLASSTMTIQNGTGVDFQKDTSPGNLPGGNSISPPFVTTFSFSAEPPPTSNGINPGETLGLVFSGGSVSLSNVLNNLNSGDLRVGLHVIAFANGGSESFVNRPPVPEPGTMSLLAAGLLGLGGVARRKMRR